MACIIEYIVHYYHYVHRVLLLTCELNKFKTLIVYTKVLVQGQVHVATCTSLV